MGYDGSIPLVPYLASSKWYAVWLDAWIRSGDELKARDIANSECGISGKDYARCIIRGNVDRIMLSIAIDGGASRLKKKSLLPRLRISDHGNWPNVHLGALDASYGRTPYFRHLMPLLSPTYCAPASSLLISFNNSIHSVVMDFLCLKEGIPAELMEASGDVIRRISGRCDEIATSVDPELSVIDSLMHLGRDTLLALLSLGRQSKFFD